MSRGGEALMSSGEEALMSRGAVRALHEAPCHRRRGRLGPRAALAGRSGRAWRLPRQTAGVWRALVWESRGGGFQV